MPVFITTGHSIDEAVHLIRTSHSRLAHVSRLIRAIQLDVQQGQLHNLEALIQLAQRRCATIRDDLGQQIEQLQLHLDEIKDEGINGTSVSASLLAPSSQHDHID